MGIKQTEKTEIKFSEPLMEAAKRKSLLGLIQVANIPHFKQGKGYASHYCPNCGLGKNKNGDNNKCQISNELWNCWACGHGGSVVDYAAYLWGVSIIEAAKKLIGEEITAAILKPGEVSGTPEPEIDYRYFYKVMRNRGRTYHQKAYDYLINERAIPKDVIDRAVRAGILRFLPEGYQNAKQWLIEIFGQNVLKELKLWKEDAPGPWVAYRPIIFILPSGRCAEWRLDHAPEAGMKKSVKIGLGKEYHLWVGHDRTKVAVVEGPIDMLSMVALGWKGDIKAIPGTGVWMDEWIDGYKYAAFTLDGDKAGMEAMEKMSEVATQKGIRHQVKAPPAGDVNLELQARRKAA